METNTQIEKRFQFHGDGFSLFKIFIVNYLLTLITLGIYYPWAKAAIKQYFYKETEFDGSRFQFHGTGKEMFIGMIKSMLIFIAIVGTGTIVNYGGYPIIGIILIYLLFIALIPFAIVSSLKYKYSRSSWRGIHFGYRGTTSTMAKEFYIGAFLCIITFGFYSCWFAVNLNREIYGNSRFGDVEFRFEGDGTDLFFKVLLGNFLTIITLGIYSFWLKADLYNYFNDNTILSHGQQEARLDSSVTGGELLKLFLIDVLLFLFTLGIATPWIIVRNLKYMQENLAVLGNLNFDNITQTEKQYTDALGENLLDDMELSIG